MDCPDCHSSSTIEREGRTVHGFRRFRCRGCGRRFNERTGTALNRVQVPTDIMFLVVFWRLYLGHLRTRKSSGEMMRKLSVTLSQNVFHLVGTSRRRKPSTA